MIIIYNKERLTNRKLEIIKKLENFSLTKDEIKNLESYISDYSSNLYNLYPIFFDNLKDMIVGDLVF